MKLRVLLPLLVFGVLTVIAVLIPVGDALSDSRTQQLALQRGTAVEQIVQRAQIAIADDDTTALETYVARFHEVYGESVVVVDDRGVTIARAGALADEARAADLIASAMRGIPRTALPAVEPWSPDQELYATPVPLTSTATSGAVVLGVDLVGAKTDVVWGWIAIATIGLILLAVLLAASFWWTQWVVRPVRALEVAVAALAEHRGARVTLTSGPPELRRLSAAFDRMATGVESALEQQRGFVADASHQLRNPLAAIRLRVDSLALGSDAPDEVRAMDRDLDRLEHTVDRMLSLADAEHRATVLLHGAEVSAQERRPTLCHVSAEQLMAHHRDRLARHGLVVEVGADAPVDVPCPQVDLDEIVDVLVDNAIKYAGAGAEVRMALHERGDTVELHFADSGTDLRDDDLELMGTRFWRAASQQNKPGTGLGLAIVAQLVRAAEGELSFERSELGGLGVRVTWRAS